MRNKISQFRVKWGWLVLLIIIKLALQLVAANQYGFHRDEFLYLVEGEHLAWGYMEVPPMIAWLAGLIRIFSDSIVFIKLFPALAGGGSIVLLALITRDLGGGRWAQIVACLAYLLVPAYLRTHHLFQPVFLNQFMWLIIMFLLIRLYKTGLAKYWYYLGAALGIGLLTKYSIVFLVLAILAGLLVTKERQWLRRREPYLALGIALVIAFPNIYWQYDHNFPVIAHMEELKRTQLVHVQPISFITSQLLMLFAASFLWVPGVFVTLGWKRLETYRVVGITYVILLILLLVLSGKAYYMLGIYPPLIAAGAVWWEHLSKRRRWLRSALPLLIVISSIGILPYGIPILGIDSMQEYCAFMKDKFGLAKPLIWEDGKMHSLPQDYADMHGWEEMAERVSTLYHALDSTERERCNIWGGSYSHASTLTFYRKKYDLPEVHSFVGSHVLWIPEKADFDSQILVDDVLSLESRFFNHVELVDSIHNPYAREKGYIYYRTDLNVDVSEEWSRLVAENKDRWIRN